MLLIGKSVLPNYLQDALSILEGGNLLPDKRWLCDKDWSCLVWRLYKWAASTNFRLPYGFFTSFLDSSSFASWKSEACCISVASLSSASLVTWTVCPPEWWGALQWYWLPSSVKKTWGSWLPCSSEPWGVCLAAPVACVLWNEDLARVGESSVLGHSCRRREDKLKVQTTLSLARLESGLRW